MSLADDLALPGAHAIPGLLSGAAVVALVPATADLAQAAQAAWHVARAAARNRRTALVDCYLDEPQLTAGGAVRADDGTGDGIVDVFEYGASLSRIARPVAPDLYFLPAGTFAPDPAAVMANPRWRRLAAGFRHEDAVMLLFLPPECLEAIAPNLDGVIALAPGGADAGLASTPEIQAVADRGVPLLATVTEIESAEPVDFEVGPPDEDGATPTAEPAPERGGTRPAAAPEPAAPRPSWRRLRAAGTRAPRALLYGIGFVVAAAEAALIFGEPLGLGARFRAGPGVTAEPAAPIVPAYRRLVPHAADSLPFTVQVSSWTSLAFALDAASALEAHGFPPIVSPLRLGARLWYRVLVGPVGTREAADSVLAALRAAGLDRPRTATPVLAPLSVALKRVATPEAARAARARLLTLGLPAFVLGQADGTYQLLAGAYATREQAAYLDSLVTSTGSAGPLGPRVGFRP